MPFALQVLAFTAVELSRGLCRRYVRLRYGDRRPLYDVCGCRRPRVAGTLLYMSAGPLVRFFLCRSGYRSRSFAAHAPFTFIISLSFRPGRAPRSRALETILRALYRGAGRAFACRAWRYSIRSPFPATEISAVSFPSLSRQAANPRPACRCKPAGPYICRYISQRIRSYRPRACAKTGGRSHRAAVVIRCGHETGGDSPRVPRALRQVLWFCPGRNGAAMSAGPARSRTAPPSRPAVARQALAHERSGREDARI